MPRSQRRITPSAFATVPFKGAPAWRSAVPWVEAPPESGGAARGIALAVLLSALFWAALGLLLTRGAFSASVILL